MTRLSKRSRITPGLALTLIGVALLVSLGVLVIQCLGGCAYSKIDPAGADAYRKTTTEWEVTTGTEAKKPE